MLKFGLYQGCLSFREESQHIHKQFKLVYIFVFVLRSVAQNLLFLCIARKRFCATLRKMKLYKMVRQRYKII